METATKSSFSEIQIRSLIKKHFPNDEISAIDRFKGGTFNTAYKIDVKSAKSYVLKASPPEWVAVPKHEKNIMQTEVIAYRLLQGSELPVPQVYAYDFSHKNVPCDYFIMDFMEGKSWYDLFPLWNSSLMRQLGKYTAKIHSVKGEFFGNINGEEKCMSWSKAYIVMIEDALSDIEHQGIKLPSDKIKNVVYSRQALLDEIIVPSLVNFDIWAGNVLIENENPHRISGIIDFERCFFGDPFASFASALFIYENVEKEQDFIAGYNEVSEIPLKISEHDRERMILYEILVYLRGYCETKRYNFWLRFAERTGIRSMLDYCLWRLERK